MFLVDSAFVIFHNSAPRMVLGEMISDLSCPEDVFEAASLDEFMMAIQAKPLPVKPLRLVDCVQNLFAESPDPQILSRLRDESALNLFTIVTGSKRPPIIPYPPNIDLIQRSMVSSSINSEHYPPFP